jgi:cephalosporin-C deacetylase-like acetyl esterase
MINKLAYYVFIHLILYSSAALIASDDPIVIKNDFEENFRQPEGIKPTIYEAMDFELNQELEITEKNNIHSLIVKKWLDFGRVQRYFCGETAQYKISLHYLDHFIGEPSINVLVNDQKVGTIKFNKPEDGSKDLFTVSEKTLSGINIPKWSQLAFDIKNDVTKERTDKLHIQRVVFTPAGPYQGEKIELNSPEPFRIFETIDEQRTARSMVSNFLENAMKDIDESRMTELVNLNTPAEWKERQREIRSRLPEYFGEFPGRTPLNAKIVGKIEREKYVIEKVIFESQPNYYCTANFYVPKDRPFPVPGVLITIGHKKEGKSRKMYHECGLGLALKGYAALVLDPMGQGERSEYFDADTKEHLIELAVDQHHYSGRPAFLVDWTLPGSRIWDCIRAVDYMVSRTEVDTSKLAVVGNSGGGVMAMFITAVDQRIKVCAAGHPGGSCEGMLLNGGGSSVFDIYSLIPPRPCRMFVGRESREEPEIRPNVEFLKPFYIGLGVPEEFVDVSIVEGLHDIKKPKRESVYEWFNKWFDKGNEGRKESPLQPEKMEDLWCTESGFTLISLGGETVQTLNAKRADQIYKPEKDLIRLKQRIARRIGYADREDSIEVIAKPAGIVRTESFEAEKFIIKSEKGIEVPALLLKSKNGVKHKPLILHVSDKGKPNQVDKLSLPIALVGERYDVLSIDVRGVGETDPSLPLLMTPYTGFLRSQAQRDNLAINSLSLKRTMLGMRTFDVLKVMDYIKSREDLNSRAIVLVGEGLGGLWALLAASYHSDADAVVCIGTLPSYKLLLNRQYYNVWNYFWVPGALRDFDIPDLSRLVAPRRQLWINPVNALAEPLEKKEISLILTNLEDYQFVHTTDTSPNSLANEIIKFLHYKERP